MTSPPPSACLFDLDGLLLDTEPIYTQVTQAIVGRYGHTYDWSLKGNMLGRPALDSARYLVRALALPITAEAYLAQRDQLLYQHFANCQAMPGAQRLVRHLQAQGIPIAVATSSKRELYTVKTQHHQDWFSLFSVVVTGDDPDLARGKPAPDIFLLAAARLGISPQRALVFEDAPSGLAAGIAAGMRVVAVPDPNMDKSRYAAADVILDSLQQFRPQVYGLPRF